MSCGPRRQVSQMPTTRRSWTWLRLKTHPTTTANALRLLRPFLAGHDQEEFRNHLIILSPGSERWIKTAANT